MKFLRLCIRILDAFLNAIGRVVEWLVVPLTLLLVYEVVTRRIFNNPNIWTVTVATQIYALHFLLYSPTALLKGAHVRVDIIYQAVGVRGRAILDIISYVVFLLIPSLVFFREGYKYAAVAWTRKQVTQSLDRIPLYPIKTVIPIMFGLLFLAALSQFFKRIVEFKTKEVYQNE